MLSNFQKVCEFNTAFGTPVPDVVDWPTKEVVSLRLRLQAEEEKEVQEAVANMDLVNLAKELADVLYVTYGFAAVCGIDLDAVFAEVHRSNMSKLGADGKPIYREDGKVLKGPQYSPADLTRIVIPNGK